MKHRTDQGGRGGWAGEIAAPLPPWARAGEFLRTLSLILLLACVVSRPFLAEVPFRASAVRGADVQLSPEARSVVLSDRVELARMIFATGLLAAAALWLAGGAVVGRIEFRHGWLWAAFLAFAVVAYIGAQRASNTRLAMDAWLEQVSLLLAGLLAAQLCTRRSAAVLVMIVVVGLCGAMAAKGLWEYFVEIPERVRGFEENRSQWLAQMGWPEGSPQAIALAGRVFDKSIIGFVSLANVLASLLLMLVLTSAGLAWDKLKSARASRAEFARRQGRGEIHLPTLGAGLLVLVVLAGAATLMLTRSRGGMIAAAICAAAAIAIYKYRVPLAVHWKKALLVVAGLFVLGAAAVVSYGLKYDRLPSKTLMFRWLYWTASAKIVEQHPVLGVGGANFDTAYLQVRDVRGEEAIKNPHNVIVHAAAEYGLLGGGLYLAILGGFLVSMCRPRPANELPRTPADPILPRRRVVFALVVAWAAAVFARLYFAGMDADGALAVLEVGVPAAVFAVMLALGVWACGEFFDEHRELAAARIAMACACAGFVLADLVNFALFLPASAAVFWLCAGSAVAQAGPAKAWTIKFARWPIALAAAAVVIGASIVVVAPVLGRTAWTNRMVAALARKDIASAILAAQAAAAADPCDALAAADAARAIGLWPQRPGETSDWTPARAYEYALAAIHDDPQNPAWQRLAGEISWRQDQAQNSRPWRERALDHLRRAVELNPQDLRLRVEFAEMLLGAGDKAAAAEQLHQATRIDEGLLPDSSERLNAAERPHVAELLLQAYK